MSLLFRVKRRFLFDLSGYEFDSSSRSGVSASVQDTVNTIRGERAAAIMIHGVMPRSGTNYLSAIVKLHPDIQPHPCELYEFPFLDSSASLCEFQQRFLSFYPGNREKFENYDFLSLFGSSILAHLYSYAESDKRIMMKVPSVRNLSHFHCLFPKENLLIIVRDGRDVTASYRKTFSARYKWPKPSFSQVCLRWKKATDLAMAYAKEHANDSSVHICKYEDLIKDPVKSIKEIGEQFQLDMSKYPFAEIARLGVKGSSSLTTGGEVTWQVKEKPLDFNPVGRWDNWSKRNRMTFNKVAGDTLIKGGWEDTYDW